MKISQGTSQSIEIGSKSDRLIAKLTIIPLKQNDKVCGDKVEEVEESVKKAVKKAAAVDNKPSRLIKRLASVRYRTRVEPSYESHE
jgi:hypothetical protein